MGDIASDFLVQRLAAWGVDRINGIMEALERAQGTERAMEFVQSRRTLLAQGDRRIRNGIANSPQWKRRSVESRSAIGNENDRFSTCGAACGITSKRSASRPSG